MQHQCLYITLHVCFSQRPCQQRGKEWTFLWLLQMFWGGVRQGETWKSMPVLTSTCSWYYLPEVFAGLKRRFRNLFERIPVAPLSIQWNIFAASLTFDGSGVVERLRISVYVGIPFNYPVQRRWRIWSLHKINGVRTSMMWSINNDISHNCPVSLSGTQPPFSWRSPHCNVCFIAWIRLVSPFIGSIHHFHSHTRHSGAQKPSRFLLFLRFLHCGPPQRRQSRTCESSEHGP